MRAFLQRLLRALLRLLWWAGLGTLGVSLVATLRYGLPWALSRDTVDRQLAALADVSGAATLVLAVLASSVALLAYYQSLKRPKIALRVVVGDGKAANVLATDTHPSGNWKYVVVNASTVMHITLISQNDVSARNPAVSVTMIDGLGTELPYAGVDWVTRYRPDGLLSVQWDGGANYLLHGGWQREVSPLNLGHLRLTHMTTVKATILVEWVADGFATHSQEISVDLH